MTPSGPLDFSQFRPDLRRSKLASSDGGESSGDLPGLLGDRASVASSSEKAVGEDQVNKPGEALHMVGSEQPGEPVVVDHPVRWVVAATLSAVTGILLAWLLSSPAVDLAAWVLAGPVAIGFSAAYSWYDVQLQARVYYTVSRPLRTLQSAVVLLCAAGVVLGALRLANWIGHR